MSSEEAQEYLLAGIKNVHINIFVDDGSKYFITGHLKYLGNVDLATNEEEQKKIPQQYQNQDLSNYKVEYWQIGDLILRYICKRKESLASKFSWIKKSEADPEYSKRLMLLTNIIQASIIALLIAGLTNEMIFYTVIFPLMDYWGYILLTILWLVSVIYLKLQFKVPYINLATSTELMFDVGTFPSPEGLSFKGKRILTIFVYQSDIIPWVQTDVSKIDRETLKMYIKDAPYHELTKLQTGIAKYKEEIEHLKADLNRIGRISDTQYFMGLATAIAMQKDMSRSLSRKAQLKLSSSILFIIIMLSMMSVAGFLIFSGSTLGLILGGAIALIAVIIMLYVFTSVFAVQTRRELYE